MKRICLVIFLILSPLIARGQLPSCYHTYDEVIDSLRSLETIYDHLMNIFPIGYSTEDSIEIYAVKLSDSVDMNLDRPRLLFIGQVHAEENIGVELVLDVIADIVTHAASTQFRRYLGLTELYFIPSANPEGLYVVTDGLDITFRKNKRNNLGTPGFRYLAGRGRDSSGVDINRNFDLNWIQGDTLWHPGHAELFDYYRGPAPFSEGENQAIRNLSEEKRFSMGIVYHQSRTGNVDENVIYPWNWNRMGDKHPPDFDAINNIGIELAGKIHSLSGGYYITHPSTGMNGNSHDWFYTALNCYNYTIETSEIQPDSALLYRIIDYNKPGLYYIIERASGQIPGLESASQLTGRVTDAVTSQPLAAEIKIVGRESGWLKPRATDPLFGRFRWYVPNGIYSIEVSSPGYETALVSNIQVSRNYPTTRNVSLQPLPSHTVQGVVTDIVTGNPIEAALFFEGNTIDTALTSDGFYSLDLPRSDYFLRIEADGHITRFIEVSVNQPLTMDWEMAPWMEVFHDDFESGLGAWSFVGDHPWGLDSREYYSGSFSLAETPAPGTLYNPNIDSSYAETTVDLTYRASAHLSFWHLHYFEPGCDYGLVEVSSDGGATYQEIAAFDSPKTEWREERLDLTPFCGSSLRIRFNIMTDANIEQPGWNLDDITVAASDTVPPSSVEKPPLPGTFQVFEPCPNPFNSETIIRFNLDKPGFLTTDVYNLLGERVERIAEQRFPQGANYIRWSAGGLPSGLYFISIKTGDRVMVKKALLIK